MGQEKKLHRNVNNKVIAGVASGLAEYFEIDVVIFRLLFVLLVLFGGGGLLAYIVMWIVLPTQPIEFQANYNHSEAPPSAGKKKQAAENPSVQPQSAPSPAVNRNSHSNTSLITGIILISMGVLFLISRTMPWINMANLWPVLLIIGGFFIIDPNILKSKNRQQ